MSEVESLLKRLAIASKREERFRLITQLGETREKKILPVLVKILNTDTDNEIKSYAANAIIKIGGKEATNQLIRLTRSKSWITRMKAAEALGEIGNKKALKCLVRMLKSDLEPNVREWSAISLGKLKSKKASKALANSMLEDPEREVRKEAAIALGKIRDKGAFKALTRSYQTDDEFQVRWAAAASIIKIDHENSKDLLKNLTDNLINILKSEKDEMILGAAAQTLGEIGNKVVAKTLYKTMKVSKELVRLEINLALGKMAKRLNYKNTEEFVKSL